MPASPAPARRAGDYVVVYRSYPTHLTAVAHRRASTGALVEVGAERIPYRTCHETMARVEGIPGPDEITWQRDPEELGAVGKRLKKFARKVAKSKLAKAVKGAVKVASFVVPGASQIVKGAKMARGAVKLTRKVVARRRAPPPPPPPVADTSDLDPEDEETGAVVKRKPKTAPKAAKKAAKSAPKPKPKPKTAPKPAQKAAKSAPKPKPKPAPKAAKKAAKSAQKPKPKPKPKTAPKPVKPAAQRAAAVAQQGGAAAALLQRAQQAPSPAAAAELSRAAALAAEIEDEAPELAATLADAAVVPRAERDLVEARAVEAARVLASTPPEARAQVAAQMERRIDAYKVIAPDGSIVYVPLEEVEG